VSPEVRAWACWMTRLSVRNPDFKHFFYIDGPPLSRQQLTAVIYLLKPEFFKISAEEKAAQEKEMAKNEAEETREKRPTTSRESTRSSPTTVRKGSPGRVRVTIPSKDRSTR